MIISLYKQLEHRTTTRIRDDQIKYFYTKSKKDKRFRIRLTFGSEVAERARINKGNILDIDWDDVNRHLIISKREKGFIVQQHKTQKKFLLIDVPGRIKLPRVEKVFTNIPVSSQGVITLDFSLVKEE